MSVELLDLDGGAGLLEVALELVGLLALHALLEAEAGRRADDLDDLDLLVAGAREDDVERGLLLLGLGGVAATAATRGGRGGHGRGGDAELLLEGLDALR